MPEIKLSLEDYIELLEYKLDALEEAQRNDSSWNYGIDELKEEINTLKNKL
jgi:chaperonin cofactor prefoldin